MINGKRSFRIFLCDNKEVEIFRKFIIRNGGDKSILNEGFLKPNQLYEVSIDLKCRYLHLVGYVSHIAYPASSMFIHNLNGFIFWYENEYLGLKDVEIIKHIPHASIEFPEIYYEANLPLIYGSDYKSQVLKMADLHIDYLFKEIKGVEIMAKYSRLYCDVERFKDDKKEPMAKLGQGYIYTKNFFNGEDYFRDIIFNGVSLLKDVDAYYDEHHLKLTIEVKRILSKGKKALILDLHSFSEEQAQAVGKSGPFPDICIGINESNHNQRILNTIIKKIEEKGYTYQINFPYRGSILPNNLTKEEMKNVFSIMIEINKRIYL